MGLLERKSETFYKKSLILFCVLALLEIKQMNMLIIIFSILSDDVW